MIEAFVLHLREVFFDGEVELKRSNNRVSPQLLDNPPVNKSVQD
jgi:hypothetical protein